MSGHKVHQYFKHKTVDWNILGFLVACNLEPFDQKIECYVLCLEVIVIRERGCRHDKVQMLLDQYKKANIMTLFFENFTEIGGMTEIGAGVQVASEVCLTSRLRAELQNWCWSTGGL